MNDFAYCLKTWPKYFEQVRTGKKTFEIRKNDRGFKEGEEVALQEFDPETGKYSGRSLHFKIGYITDFEQKPGYVVFSLLPVTVEDPRGLE